MLSAIAAVLLVGRAAIAEPTSPSPPPPKAPPYDEASVWLPVGVLASVSSRGTGIGAEVTLDLVGDMLTDQAQRPWKQNVGFGLLAQYQRVSEGANRIVGGGQVVFGGYFGIEGGVVWRLKPGANETGIHLAPFLSVGFLAVSLVVDLPQSHEGPDEPHPEVGVALTFKYPFPLNGEWPSFKVGG